MGTKNNPGKSDCYANAGPDEPMFVLLGRDHEGPALVLLWAFARQRKAEAAAVVTEAIECADAMVTELLSRGRMPDWSLLRENKEAATWAQCVIGKPRTGYWALFRVPAEVR